MTSRHCAPFSICRIWAIVRPAPRDRPRALRSRILGKSKLGLFSQHFLGRDDTKSKDEMLRLKAHYRRCTSKPILLLFLFCTVWIFTSSHLLSFSPLNYYGFVASSSNSTLGFGRIYVVSQQGSSRRKSIIQAANVTELELTIPVQPIWTEDDQRNFRLAKDSTIGKGSLLAWLGHLHALQQ